MTENEAIEKLKNEIDVLHKTQISIRELKDSIIAEKARKIAISALEEIQQYRALGTVEELQKAKAQYEDIASCAEKISMSGLYDYEEAQRNIVSS